MSACSKNQADFFCRRLGVGFVFCVFFFLLNGITTGYASFMLLTESDNSYISDFIFQNNRNKSIVPLGNTGSKCIVLNHRITECLGPLWVV